MVTIFDMLTGETLYTESAQVAAPAAGVEDHRELAAPRLQTVEESLADEAPQRAMPADLAQADVARFLSRQ